MSEATSHRGEYVVHGLDTEDPFKVLGVAEDADDATIRRAYLRLLHTYSPERDPDGFRHLRAAYEAVRSVQDRAAQRLLERPKLPDVEPLIRGLAAEPIPKDRSQILSALGAAVLRTLPELKVSQQELRPIPDALSKEVLPPSGGSDIARKGQ